MVVTGIEGHFVSRSAKCQKVLGRCQMFSGRRCWMLLTGVRWSLEGIRWSWKVLDGIRKLSDSFIKVSVGLGRVVRRSW